MGKEYPIIDETIRTWIEQQKMFFVSTAPDSPTGLINCSPKGMDTFRILGEKSIGYLDLTGSGIETVAHLKENRRIVIMMCAFHGPPKIFRFHGKGEVLEKGSKAYEELLPRFVDFPGARAIIKVDVERIADSCGYSIPFYEFRGDRDVLLKWAEKKGEGGVVDYQEKNNRKSLDGLTGL